MYEQQGRHLQPPCTWIRVIRSLLAVPSRHPEQPPRWRRLWNCAICAHNTAFVGRPLLNGGVELNLTAAFGIPSSRGGLLSSCSVVKLS
ncbi:hypothetical protein CDAR_575751 [Caerostris darwini]|uniref:Uncharacterized protein n=1 Tax=Caerostris darwini TaxID=1538125 RepID=A0AAV4X644_9ARAC|nr:hypothetical protein CDAR_575751 [Caerostris darwini]